MEGYPISPCLPWEDKLEEGRLSSSLSFWMQWYEILFLFLSWYYLSQANRLLIHSEWVCLLTPGTF